MLQTKHQKQFRQTFRPNKPLQAIRDADRLGTNQTRAQIPVGYFLLFQFGISAVLVVPRYEKEHRQSYQQMGTYYKHGCVSKAYVIIQDTTNGWSNEGSQSEHAGPEARYQTESFQIIRETIRTKMKL